MAKVIKNFKERLHGLKRYNIGDEYPDDDVERVNYLASLGFLSATDGEKTDKRKRQKKGADINADPDA